MSRTGYRVFLFILVFSPLAFGSVEQWSLSVLEVLTFAALLFFLLKERKGGESPFYDVPGIIPLFCLWAYFILQLIPLPSGFVRLISPETYNLHAETAGIVEPVTWLSLSFQRKRTLLEFFRFSAYGAFYILTVQMLTRKELLKKTITAVIIFSSSLAFLGILQYLFYNKKIFWFRELTLGGTPFGPFVNRNHYAGFMEMIFPVVLSAFLALKPRVRYVSLREKLSELLNRTETNTYILIGLASIVIATSVFLSLSRGGIMSLSISMIFLGCMLALKKTNRKRGVIITAVFILIVFSVGWFGWEPVFKRFEKMRDLQGNIADLRPAIWKDSVSIIKDFPLTGTGFGTFVAVYPKYRTLTGRGIVDHAHNDYIELLAEGGIIAFLLAAWFLFAVLYKSFRRFLLRKESYSAYLFMGCLTGMIAILLHSFTDFNLHIGANGLYFFFLAGLTVSSAHTRLRGESHPTYLKAIPSPPTRLIRVLTVLFLLSALPFNSGILIGRLYFSSIQGLDLKGKIDEKKLVAVREKAHRASLFDPLEPKYAFTAANAESMLFLREGAVKSYRRAIDQDPLNGEYLQGLGLMYSGPADHGTAERLFRAGIACDVTNPARYKTYVLWLFSQGRKEDGLRYVQKSLEVSPEATVEFITSMVLYELNDDEIRRALPGRAAAHLAFADYLEAIGKEDEAGNAYLDAIRFMDREKEIKAAYFHKVYGYFSRKGLFDEALRVMQRAQTFLPEDAGIRSATGLAYEKIGMRYRAAEEYKRALILDPGNSEAQKRLDALAANKN